MFKSPANRYIITNFRATVWYLVSYVLRKHVEQRQRKAAGILGLL